MLQIQRLALWEILYRECPVDSFEVKEIIGEYGFVMKQLYQLKDEKGMMFSHAQSYCNEEVKKATDEKYGSGAAQFFMQAIETFYHIPNNKLGDSRYYNFSV